MIRVPVSTHFALSDFVVDAEQQRLHKQVYASRTSGSRSRDKMDVPKVEEVRSSHIKTLKHASQDLLFAELFFSLRLVSNLSSHDKSPFVHIWTSLSDQGIGKLEFVHKEKQLFEERDAETGLHKILSSTASAAARATSGKGDVKEEETVDAFLSEMESKRPYIRDGTIQVPLQDFSRQEEDTLVSDFSHFTLFFPLPGDAASKIGQKARKKGARKQQFVFESKYPADAAIHFQIHSDIGNSEGKSAYALTGTGSVSIAEITSRVRQFLARCGEEDGKVMEPIEIPMILNAVSSQDPRAKLVETVNLESTRRRNQSKGQGSLEPQSRNEALYEGSLFLFVRTEDPVTKDFFAQHVSFDPISRDDVTRGNFSRIAASMKMHVLRDMAPFISDFTKDIATITERDARGRISKRGWTFEASLPEAEDVHAPWNKVNTHTLPGFTFYHDRGMQRLPSSTFLLHVTRIVLERHNMSEKDFVRHANNPVLGSLPRSSSGTDAAAVDHDALSSPDAVPLESKGTQSFSGLYINPEYVRVVRIVSEIATAFPTSMTYRGDYADLNTDAVANYEAIIQDPDLIHHAVHASGMTRVSAGKHPSRYVQRWEETLKIGTEMFGDATIDRSGDCEDLDKLISRILAGMYSAKSAHPTILAIQSVLQNYVPFSVLGSVTSRNIREAPDDDDGNSSASHIGGVIVGSKKDLRAGIGAHMYGALLPKKDVLKSIQRTSSRVETLPDGSILSQEVQTEISERVLHKPMWEMSEGGEPVTVQNRLDVSRNRKATEVARGKISRTKKIGQSVRENVDAIQQHLERWTKPLPLEGTGQANALVNAISSYYERLGDKVASINGSILHIEAVSRLVSGMPSDQVTPESIQAYQGIFSAFVMPIETNRLVDASPDLRISLFYRMLTEIYGIPAGNTDERITPKELVLSQLMYNRSLKTPGTIEKIAITGTIDLPGFDASVPATSSGKKAFFGSVRATECIYAMDRVFPVQMAPRRLASAPKEEDEGKQRYLTYGVNLTDFVHKSDNIGMIRTVKSMPNELRVISNVLRHTAPSTILRLPPAKEIAEAKRVAGKYERLLNGDIDRTLSRGFFGHLARVSLFTRLDAVQDEEIEKLAEYLADNGYARKAEVRAESFARGHHLLRITIDMDVSGAKQLYLDSNTLAERMSEEKMNDVLISELEALLQS